LKSDRKLSLALNGEMALHVAARTPPDLVLLDIETPGRVNCAGALAVRGLRLQTRRPPIACGHQTPKPHGNQSCKKHPSGKPTFRTGSET
jgi:CheY-like chemotaxis protein